MSLVLGLLALSLGVSAAQAEHHEGEVVTIHLSHFSDDLHAVNMALKLGTVLQDKGSRVTLFVDLEGVRLADSRQPLDLRWGTTAPIGELYKGFVDAGGRVLVCPHCAAAVGLEASSLRSGATLGTNESIAELLQSAAKILDY
jgi:predicted peroxiredoxin